MKNLRLQNSHVPNSFDPAVEPRRKKFFWVILFTIPLVFLAGTEFVLRAIDYGGNLNLVIKKTVLGKEYYTLNREVARRYFSQKGIGIPEAYDDIFEVQKRPTTKRIFMLGESTMAGYPFDYNATAPRLLSDRLTQLLPQYNIEVVNVGLAAVNSYTVLDFIKELVSYQPDVFIVFLGHNEFYGAMGIGSTEYLGQWRWLVNLYLGMRELRLFLLVRDGMVALRSLFVQEATPRDATLMEVMVREKAIPHNSQGYKLAKENFGANLVDIIAVAKKHGVPIVLSTLASNIRDQEPLLPTFGEGRTAEEKYLWENLTDHGAAALQIGNFQDALRCFGEAIQIDSMNALAHFYLAECLDTLGKFSEAKRGYENARDYDGLRFRASSDFNELIRTICKREDIALADAERAFERESPRGITGSSLMLEHLHPNFDGYFLLAKTFFQTIVDRNLIASPQDWQWNRNLSDAEFKERSGVTEFDHEVASFRIFQLTRGWPFAQESETKPFYHAENKIQELAVQYARKCLAWSQARYDLADWYIQNGNYGKARREYFAVSKVIPYYYYPFMRMGDMDRLMGKNESAEQSYRLALSLSAAGGSPFVHVRLGMLYFDQDKTSDAISEFEATVQTETVGSEKMKEHERSTVRYFLGAAYGKRGDLEKSRMNLRLALQINPLNEDARKLLAQIP